MAIILATLSLTARTAYANNLKGMDISHLQGNVDFKTIKGSGIQFSYVKATEGISFIDPMFATYVKNARAAGLPIGAYHYATPVAPLNLIEAKTEATFFVSAMKNGGLNNFGDVMPVLDLEEPSSVGVLNGEDLAAWTRAFVDTVKQQTNRQVLLYTGAWFIDLYGGFKGELSDLPLWVADYHNRTSPTLPPNSGWKTWTIWQYTDQGSINGATGPVDLNVGPTSLQQLQGFITAQPNSNSAIRDFKDIQGHWAQQCIQQLVERGVVHGFPDGTFKPDQTITRAQFITMIVRAFDVQPENQPKAVFNDTREHWAKEDIDTAYANGMINGYTATTFGVNEPITREQIAVILTKIKNNGTVENQPVFKDSESISTWARKSVVRAVTQGIVNGYPDETFRPKDAASRAEACTMISNALKIK